MRANLHRRSSAEKKKPAALRPPVFVGGGDSYTSDTCDSLVEACAKGDVVMHAFARSTYPGTHLSPECLPNLCSLGYWDAKKDQQWGLDWHRNEGIEITFLSAGTLDFAVSEVDYPLSAGQLTVTRPWQRHRLGKPYVASSRLHWLILDVEVRKPNDPWRWPEWLVFDEAELNRLTDLLQHNEYPVMQGTKEIENCFARAAAVIDQGSPELAKNRIKIYINEILVLLLDVLENAGRLLNQELSSSRHTVQVFLGELHRHLDYEWTVEDMANECGLARSRFNHYCKIITNLPPLDYLSQLRLETATRLLATTDLPVALVAAQCGYQSSRYFSTKFRAFANCSPSDYRLSHGG
jgi:AraC family L-rhamnose operon regulatory protein RhaS